MQPIERNWFGTTKLSLEGVASAVQTGDWGRGGVKDLMVTMSELQHSFVEEKCKFNPIKIVSLAILT